MISGNNVAKRPMGYKLLVNSQSYLFEVKCHASFHQLHEKAVILQHLLAAYHHLSVKYNVSRICESMVILYDGVANHTQ